mmetsp:Transcript_12756/g.17518  ORF Transcript_12756/g.17518 Transcript_12756/m.17518 type:complete len:96 (-) Transcript_12756:274-561(-)
MVGCYSASSLTLPSFNVAYLLTITASKRRPICCTTPPTTTHEVTDDVPNVSSNNPLRTIKFLSFYCDTLSETDFFYGLTDGVGCSRIFTSLAPTL